VAWVGKTRATDPNSTTSPAFITATVSATLRRTARSWLMNTGEPSMSRCRRENGETQGPLQVAEDGGIWARTVASSAVVGSSAMSSEGFVIGADAIITRWRWPPES
jgi:hypothetical protein